MFLWKFCRARTPDQEKCSALFLSLHTLLEAAAGLFLWAILFSSFCQGLSWAFIFTAGFGYFPGFLGGILFLWRGKPLNETAPRTKHTHEILCKPSSVSLQKINC